MTDFQLSTPVTSPTAIRPVDRYELGDAIRNAWLKHGQDSWLTIADEVFAALAQPSPEGELTNEELLQIFDAACLSEGGTTDELHLRGLRAVLAADRARRPAPEPPAEGEVGELVAALRQAAQSLTPHHSIIPLEAVRFTRAAELLERLSPPPCT